MAMVMNCDLCGKPISGQIPRCFKIKELKGSWHEQYWEFIDAHADCVRKLFNATNGKPDDGLKHYDDGSTEP